ncbi:hypothetical protein ACM7KD_23135 [Pseudomonas aeruginosa]|uniref:hypothetical protein n=1 Tax=Pseudomonas aeruginosa TaxID=287 RepID=UPI0013C4EE31|nr:hypothetical protein [Pseudomonas aeruginosa]
MFEEIANSFSGQVALKAVERFDEYSLICTTINTTPEVALSQSAKLLKQAESIPERDKFELQIEFQGDPITIVSTQSDALRSIADHFEAHDEAGEVRYEITIRKSISNALSIYCLKSLGQYLASEDLPSVLAALDGRFDKGISFECLCETYACGSNTIRFWPKGKVAAIEGNDLRSQVFNTFRDNSYSSGLKTNFLPSDFKLIERTGITSIDNFMDKACALLSAVYLANSSQMVQPCRVKYKLIGYKSIEGEVELSDLLKAKDSLFKIYDWAYGVGGSADRIGLARNVVSLHVDRLEDIEDHPGLWNAIHSNYQIYLKANVASYLEVKNKITEFLIESTAKTHALVEDLINSLKNSIFVILTFILTVVVVNGLKDSGQAVIFSTSYFYIVLLLCITLTIWIVGSSLTAIRRFDNSAETTTEVLNLGYSRILLSSEISDSIAPINQKNRSYLVRQCWRYFSYWVLITIVLIGGFWIGHKAFGTDSMQVTVSPSTLQEKEPPANPGNYIKPQPDKRNHAPVIEATDKFISPLKLPHQRDVK